jgi:hypothetical protein
MPITQQSLASSIQSNINARWPWERTKQADQLIDAYATSLGLALVTSLSGAVLASGAVAGGTAPPSGPVIGATLSYLPGALTTPPLDLSAVFVPPKFTAFIEETGKTLEGEYTPWLRCFTDSLSKSAKTAWTTFTSTWSLPGAVVVGGGLANWVASTPPVPGPWAGGTITTPFRFVGSGFGVSTYLWDLFDSDFVGVGKSASVTIPIQASDPITTTLLATEHSEKLARAISGGFADTVSSVISSLTVIDPTGSGGSGVAAPGGIVTGTLTGALLNLAA